MSAEGGEHETVEMFVLEAYEANVVLQLYEAASGPTVNVPATARYMSNRKPPDYGHPAGPPKTEKEVWSQDDELAPSWAFRRAENAVSMKVEKDVYPSCSANAVPMRRDGGPQVAARRHVVSDATVHAGRQRQGLLPAVRRSLHEVASG